MCNSERERTEWERVGNETNSNLGMMRKQSRGQVGDLTANHTPLMDEMKAKPTVRFVGDLRRKQRREKGALLVLGMKPSKPRVKPSPPVEI